MPCRTCGSPLAADQRYCLECGDRTGPPRLDWRAMVVGGQVPSAAGGPVEQDDGVGPGLPSPRVAAGLVLGVLAFGVAIGNAATPDRADAGGRPPWTLVAQAPAAAPAATPSPVAPDATTTPAPPDASGDVDLGDDDPSTPADDAAGVDADADTDADADADATTEAPATDGDASAGDDDTSTPTEDDGTGTDDTTATAAAEHPPVKHVWVIALTGHSLSETFGDGAPGSGTPYLGRELRAKGTLLPWYHAPGHDPAAGGVALLGGQKDGAGPFDDNTPTLVDQLSSVGQSWRAYVEGATAGLAPGDSPCAVPADQQPRNPFLRFRTIAGGTDCQVVEPAQLAQDVADSASAPAFSYILPGPAHDGSTSLADADAWLRTIVPTILDSKAYKDGGLVVITFDAGAPTDAEAGGGRVGALLLSPFVAPGGAVEAPYDPFSLLNSIQDLFGLSPRLGYGAETKLKAFGPKVYAAWSPDGDDAPNADR